MKPGITSYFIFFSIARIFSSPREIFPTILFTSGVYILIKVLFFSFLWLQMDVEAFYGIPLALAVTT